MQVLIVDLNNFARYQPWGLIDQRLRYWSAVSTNPLVKRVRAGLAARHGPRLARESDRVFRDFQSCLSAETKPDVVLISTYLMYHDLCARICAACAEHNLPVIVGGRTSRSRRWLSSGSAWKA